MLSVQFYGERLPIMKTKNMKRVCTKTDRLSHLPDEILSHIISLLPLKQAVATSILSKRWKNLYPLISSLDLDDCISKPRKSIRCGFENVVDRVLFARKGTDVNKFRLKCGQGVDAWKAEGWIQYALWHNVRELELDLGAPIELHLMLPSGLFTCNTLVTFRLMMENSFVLEIPRNVSLPSLKNLYLESIGFSGDDSIERLFSSCSVLEELVLQSCSFANINELNVSSSTLKRLTISHYPRVYEYKKDILINAPSLVYLKYFHFIAKHHLLVDLHSLVEAHIDFGPVMNSVLHGATDLIKGICHVQSLHLSGPFSEAFLLDHGPIPVLENMTDLKIGKCHPEGWERVLNFAPCLKTLIFEDIPYRQGNSMNPPKEVPPMSRIKVIKFLLFRGTKYEMQMVEYFLKHAKVLERLIIHIIVRMNQRLKITQELLKFPRVSMKCQVVIV